MSKQVTWLLPVKNGMPYLPETLASIEAQTYCNWEVLAWDNGSTDRTVEELHKWIPSRLPGRVIAGQPLSLGNSLAEMVKQCETEFCARIDADDVNVPERLEQQVAFLLAHPEVAVVGSQVNRLDKHGVNHGPYTPWPVHHHDIVFFMLASNGIAHPTVSFRRSAVLQVGNYRDLLGGAEDYDLWLRVAIDHKLANFPAPLLHYRVHDKSCTQIAYSRKESKDRLADQWDECVCKIAPLLYGCLESETRLLRKRRHPCAIRLLYQIAQHLQHSQNCKLVDILKSEFFFIAARRLVSLRDVISLLALLALQPHRTSGDFFTKVFENSAWGGSSRSEAKMIKSLVDKAQS